jgi:hypothetical protein
MPATSERMDVTAGRDRQPLSGGMWIARTVKTRRAWAGGFMAVTTCHPSAAGIAARKGELAAKNLRAASQLDGKNVRKGCAGLMAPLAYSALDLCSGVA